MAIGFRTPQTPVEQSAQSSPTTVNFPTGTVAGDVLLLKTATGGSSTSNVTTPAGWTQIAQRANTGDTLAPNAAVFIRVCTGTEGGSVSVTHGVLFSAQVLAFTGVDTSTSQDFAAVIADITSAGTGVPFPGFTVATSGAALAYVISGNSTTITATPATGFTEDADRTVASSRGWETAHLLGQAAGAVSSGAISPTFSGSVRSIGILVGLRPATISANAGFSGDGTASFVGTPTIAAPAGFSGAGTLTLAGKPTIATNGGFSGSGTVSFAGTPSVPASAAFSGAGTLTLVGKPTVATVASYSGSGTLTLTGALGGASATYSGSGTLTLVGTPTIAAAAGFSGSGTVAFGGKPSLAASAAFSGAGTLTLGGKPTAASPAGYSGSGTLVLSGSARILAPSLFSGVGLLTLSDGHTPADNIDAVLRYVSSPDPHHRGFHAAAASLGGAPDNLARARADETTWVGPVDYSPAVIDLQLAIVPLAATPTNADFHEPDLVDGHAGLFLAPSARGTYGCWARDGAGGGVRFASLSVT